MQHALRSRCSDLVLYSLVGARLYIPCAKTSVQRPIYGDALVSTFTPTCLLRREITMNIATHSHVSYSVLKSIIMKR